MSDHDVEGIRKNINGSGPRERQEKDKVHGGQK